MDPWYCFNNCFHLAQWRDTSEDWETEETCAIPETSFVWNDNVSDDLCTAGSADMSNIRLSENVRRSTFKTFYTLKDSIIAGDWTADYPVKVAARAKRKHCFTLTSLLMSDWLSIVELELTLCDFFFFHTAYFTFALLALFLDFICICWNVLSLLLSGLPWEKIHHKNHRW